MSCPPSSHLFAIHIHGNCKQTQEETRAPKRIHNLLGSSTRNPWVGVVRQPVKHEVFEQHIHNEDLVGLVAEGVEAVREGGEDADEHADHHYTLQKGAEGSS